jgi:GT2 family glycosyltransferase
VGGFDEENLAVAFQDVDLCLKICEKGYRIVYTPYARLCHHESATKTEKIPNPREVAYMQRRWRKYIDDDPYYNPNLTRNAEDYALRVE